MRSVVLGVGGARVGGVSLCCWPSINSRSMVNLQTDLLDTPEFFWEYDKYEAMYLSCREQLDVDQRVVVVNQRIEVLQDVYDVLEHIVT